MTQTDCLGKKDKDKVKSFLMLESEDKKIEKLNKQNHQIIKRL
jgi:hypothetical protein